MTIKCEDVEDYEEGALSIPVRKKWWQFWLPKTICIGMYTMVGNRWQFILNAGRRYVITSDNVNFLENQPRGTENRPAGNLLSFFI